MNEGGLRLTERLLRAHESFRNGDVNCAHETCEQILASNPENAIALHLLGIIDCHFKNFEAAALKIFKAIQNDPQNAYFFYNLGLVLKTQTNLAEAFNFFQNALALKSTQPKKNEKPQVRAKGTDLAIEAYRHSINSNQDTN